MTSGPPEADGDGEGDGGLPTVTVTWVSASASSLLGNLGQQQCHCEHLSFAWLSFTWGLGGTFKAGVLIQNGNHGRICHPDSKESVTPKRVSGFRS